MNNGILGVNELGSLACDCSTLQRFICSDDSDKDIWPSLLQNKWPSTTIMPRDELNRLSYRSWYAHILSLTLSTICESVIEFTERHKLWDILVAKRLENRRNCYQSEEENSRLWVTHCFLRRTSWFSLMYLMTAKMSFL